MIIDVTEILAIVSGKKPATFRKLDLPPSSVGTGKTDSGESVNKNKSESLKFRG
jgi:hypothetical protein